MTFPVSTFTQLQTSGYTHTPLLSPDELARLRGFIRSSIEDAIGMRIDDLGAYHSIVSDEQHRIMGAKPNRVLKPAHADAVLGFDSIQAFRGFLPGYVPQEVTYGELQSELRPEVYFRLVRPGHDTDVGAAHCDRWFHELYNIEYRHSMSYKMWVSVESSAGENGLIIYPGSTSHPLSYVKVDTPDGPKPKPDFDLSEIGPGELMPAEPGDALIFNHNVFHKGAVNNANRSRVSIEITWCRPETR